MISKKQINATLRTNAVTVVIRQGAIHIYVNPLKSQHVNVCVNLIIINKTKGQIFNPQTLMKTVH